jgi:hypothetical protein
MTLDHQIKTAFETLTARLRGEIDSQVQSAIAELSAAAVADRERAESEARAAADDVPRKVAAASQEAREAGHAAGKEEGRREGIEEGRRDGIEEGRREGVEVGRRQGIEEGRREGVKEGRRDGIAEGRQQAEQESRQAVGAAVAAALAANTTGTPAVDAGANERLATAVRSVDEARSLSEILDTVVSCASQQAARAGVWLVRGGRFSSWRVIGFGPEFDNDLSNRSLDLWHDDAGMIAEAVRTNTVVIGETAEAGPPPFAAEPAVRASLAVPIAMSGQVVAVLYADDGPSNPPANMLNPSAVEILGRYAARCLEALTAFKAARALTERPGRPDASGTPTADGAESEDDASARRYARLLVSEIKLYHESAVLDGRRDRDLGTRLGGEIARARVLYEQRVPPEVRQRADFFHDELVRTLANGDATLLELKI